MKTTLFLGFGVMFWVPGAPTRIQTLNPAETSEFRRPLLCRKGAHLNITSQFPTPLQSEHS
jgi:hypothetical protein